MPAHVGDDAVAAAVVAADKNGDECLESAVCVRGNAVGETLFYGAGAGRMPTASAMVADILDTMRRGNGRKFIEWGPEKPGCLVAPDDVPARWFVRCAGECVSALAVDCVSENGFCAAVTEPMLRAQLAEKLGGADVKSIFRVMD